LQRGRTNRNSTFVREFHHVALNIKDKETEALVAEIAALTGETKTGAVRQAARERLERVHRRANRRKRTPEELQQWLETEIWSQVPDELLGRGLSKAEREEILGYGPDGV
jgi:antitoxin VapB